jgi:Arc/MetJ-type ribon-helix-helix transcriptional regulator
MKSLEYIREKKAKGKRVTRSVSLPKELWEKYDEMTSDGELSMSDLVEEALRRFEAELIGANTMPEGVQQ